MKRKSRSTPAARVTTPAVPGVSRPRSSRRVTAIALLLSAGIHASILGLRFDLPAIGRGPYTAPRPSGGPVVPAMRVVEIIAVSSARPEPPPRVDPTVSPRPSEVEPDPATRSSFEAPAPVVPPASFTERVRTRGNDSRLWSRPAEPVDAYAMTTAVRPLRSRIEEYDDSVAAESEAARRSADWTHTDSAGSRWGITPDSIHLGGRKLVLRYCTAGPCPGWTFGVQPSRRDEYQNRLRGFAEIRQQAARVQIESNFDERVRAIRGSREKRDK